MELWHLYFIVALLLVVIVVLFLWVLDLQKLVRKLGGNPSHIWLNDSQYSVSVKEESVVTAAEPDPEVSDVKAEELACQAQEASVVRTTHDSSNGHHTNVVPIEMGRVIASVRKMKRIPRQSDSDDEGPFSK